MAEIQVRIHVLHLDGKVIPIQLATEDTLQVLTEKLCAPDGDLETRDIRWEEKWEPLDVIPMRVGDEEVNLPAFPPHDLRPEFANATPGIENELLRPVRHAEAARISSVPQEARPWRWSRTARPPERIAISPLIEFRDEWLR